MCLCTTLSPAESVQCLEQARLTVLHGRSPYASSKKYSQKQFSLHSRLCVEYNQNDLIANSNSTPHFFFSFPTPFVLISFLYKHTPPIIEDPLKKKEEKKTPLR